MSVEPFPAHVEIRPDVRLHVRRWGRPDGRTPFLLVHGLASNARMWDGCAAHLAGTHGRYAVAVDLRGHGQSDRPDDGYDFTTVTDDLLALMSAEGLDSSRHGAPVVAGQSWGGNVVIELAWRAGEQLAGAVAVDGGVIELADRFPRWEDCARQLAPPDLLGMRASRLEATMRAAHSDWPASGITGAMANFEVLGDGTIRPWLSRERHMLVLRALWEHRPSRRFAEISRPVMLVPADSGAVSWTADKHSAIAGAAASAGGPMRVEWFSPADHDLHAQHPERLADLLAGACDEGFFNR